MISMHCVDAAMAYANGEQHEGNGYFLLLKLEDGEVLEGTASWATLPLENERRNDGRTQNAANAEKPGLNISLETDVLMLLVTPDPEKPDQREEVFIDKKRIVKATIVW